MNISYRKEKHDDSECCVVEIKGEEICLGNYCLGIIWQAHDNYKGLYIPPNSTFRRSHAEEFLKKGFLKKSGAKYVTSSMGAELIEHIRINCPTLYKDVVDIWTGGLFSFRKP